MAIANFIEITGYNSRVIINELIGKKVVVHVINGPAVVLHRGVLEGADTHFLKLKKDSETIFFVLVNVVALQGV
jgi:hypothetical protein